MSHSLATAYVKFNTCILLRACSAQRTWPPIHFGQRIQLDMHLKNGNLTAHAKISVCIMYCIY